MVGFKPYVAKDYFAAALQPCMRCESTLSRRGNSNLYPRRSAVPGKHDPSGERLCETTGVPTKRKRAGNAVDSFTAFKGARGPKMARAELRPLEYPGKRRKPQANPAAPQEQPGFHHYAEVERCRQTETIIQSVANKNWQKKQTLRDADKAFRRYSASPVAVERNHSLGVAFEAALLNVRNTTQAGEPP